MKQRETAHTTRKQTIIYLKTGLLFFFSAGIRKIKKSVSILQIDKGTSNFGTFRTRMSWSLSGPCGTQRIVMIDNPSSPPNQWRCVCIHRGVFLIKLSFTSKCQTIVESSQLANRRGEKRFKVIIYWSGDTSLGKRKLLINWINSGDIQL